jgi:hypothetical protein
VYHFELSTEIDATRERVWRALCRPEEVVRWDAGVVEALDAPPDYPAPGQRVRWRYRSGPFRLLIDEPQEVVSQTRLRSHLRLGPYDMDETYELAPRGGACTLRLSVDLSVRVPILGILIGRLYAGPATRDGFAASLDGLKRYCEAPSA